MQLGRHRVDARVPLGHQGHILQTILQLGGVILICQTNMSHQFPHGTNIFLGGPFAGIIKYVAVHCRLTTSERNLPVSIPGPAVLVVASSAPPPPRPP